jgi:hypothetical protein
MPNNRSAIFCNNDAYLDLSNLIAENLKQIKAAPQVYSGIKVSLLSNYSPYLFKYSNQLINPYQVGETYYAGCGYGIGFNYTYTEGSGADKKTFSQLLKNIYVASFEDVTLYMGRYGYLGAPGGDERYDYRNNVKITVHLPLYSKVKVNIARTFQDNANKNFNVPIEYVFDNN